MSIPTQAPGGRHAGGRPPHPRYRIPVTVYVDVSAPDPASAVMRVAVLMGRTIGNPGQTREKHTGRPAIDAIDVGHPEPLA